MDGSAVLEDGALSSAGSALLRFKYHRGLALAFISDSRTFSNLRGAMDGFAVFVDGALSSACPEQLRFK